MESNSYHGGLEHRGSNIGRLLIAKKMEDHNMSLIGLRNNIIFFRKRIAFLHRGKEGMKIGVNGVRLWLNACDTICWIECVPLFYF